MFAARVADEYPTIAESGCYILPDPAAIDGLVNALTRPQNLFEKLFGGSWHEPGNMFRATSTSARPVRQHTKVLPTTDSAPEKKVEHDANNIFTKQVLDRTRGHLFHGTNAFDIAPPDLATATLENFTSPFFIFQITCTLLWMLDSYWYQSLFTFFMLVLLEVQFAGRRVLDMQELRAQMEFPNAPVLIFKGGENNKWSVIGSRELLPGDVVGLFPSKILACAADVMLLEKSSCLCDESMLTGETLPQTKLATTLTALVAGEDHAQDRGVSSQEGRNNSSDSERGHVVLERGQYIVGEVDIDPTSTGIDKAHIVYSGTKIVHVLTTPACLHTTSSTTSTSEVDSLIAPPPMQLVRQVVQESVCLKKELLLSRVADQLHPKPPTGLELLSGKAKVNASAPSSSEETRDLALQRVDEQLSDDESDVSKFAVGVVLNTSYDTKQGGLIRVIVSNAERATLATSQSEIYYFLLILLLFGVASVLFLLRDGLVAYPEEHSQAREKWFAEYWQGVRQRCADGFSNGALEDGLAFAENQARTLFRRMVFATSSSTCAGTSTLDAFAGEEGAAATNATAAADVAFSSQFHTGISRIVSEQPLFSGNSDCTKMLPGTAETAATTTKSSSATPQILTPPDHLHYSLRDLMLSRPLSAWNLFLTASHVLTAAVPPEFPTTLSFVTSLFLVALHRLKIYCTEPHRFRYAGQVTTCCFDKTGTLTSNNYAVEALVNTEPQLPGNEMMLAKLVVGGCHSLVAVDRSTSRKPSKAGGAGAIRSPAVQLPGIGGSLNLLSPRPRPDSGTTSSGAPFARPTASGTSGLEIIGDPAERAAFEFAGWEFAAASDAEVVDQLGGAAGGGTTSTTMTNASTGGHRMTILRRFLFRSELQRMSTLVRVDSPTRTHYASLVKGSPEVLKSRIAFPSPAAAAAYEREARKLTQRGLRVLALASRDMENPPRGHFLEVEKNNKHEQNTNQGESSGQDSDPAGAALREEMESGLLFAGFLALRSPLKPGTKKTLAELRKCGHKCVMITGDAEQTACHVAKESGILSRGSRVLTPVLLRAGDVGFDSTPTQGKLARNVRWRRVEDGGGHLVHRGSGEEEDPLLSFEHVLAKNRKYRKHVRAAGSDADADDAKYALCVSFSHLEQMFQQNNALAAAAENNSASSDAQSEFEFWAQTVYPHVSVFARATPDCKKRVLGVLEAHGEITLMIGDGLNDVGAMKKAHVGMSLLDVDVDQQPATAQLGEASIASPFTYRGESIACVSKLLQAGRGACCVTLQMYQIMGVNSVVLACGLTIVTFDGTRTSETQAILESLFICSLFFLISRSKTTGLTKERPVTNLFAARSLGAMLLQVVAHLLCLKWSLDAADRSAARRRSSGTGATTTSTSATQLRVHYGASANAEFVPTLRGTVCFFSIQVNQLANFWGNYGGRPFLVSFHENKPLFRVWAGYLVVLVVLFYDVVPGLGWLFGFYFIPEELREELAGIFAVDMALAVGGTGVVKRLCRRMGSS
eukprot:g7478.t1